MVVKCALSVTEVLLSGDDISIKRRPEVIVDIFSWVLPLSLGGSGTNLEFVTNHAFREFDGIKVVVNIVISSEVRNGVVNIITETLLLVLELSAAS